MLEKCDSATWTNGSERKFGGVLTDVVVSVGIDTDISGECILKEKKDMLL